MVDKTSKETVKEETETLEELTASMLRHIEAIEKAARKLKEVQTW